MLAAGLATTGVSIDGRPLARAAQRGGTLQRWRVPAGPPGRALSSHGAAPWRRSTANSNIATPLAQQSRRHRPKAVSCRPQRSGIRASCKRASPAAQLDADAHAAGRPEGSCAGHARRRTGQPATAIARASIFPGRARASTSWPAPTASTSVRCAAATAGMLRLRTVFAPALGPLAKDYLDSVAGYIARYEAAIGPYPFEGFSVVSSPTPTGFGMPTLTYLGESVLRLPFIRHSSLGHEVLHNWWGNGVYPDYASGNWSEGLTTFMADYAYARKTAAPTRMPDAQRLVA